MSYYMVKFVSTTGMKLIGLMDSVQQKQRRDITVLITIRRTTATGQFKRHDSI